jgi:hypothetical protein
MQSLVDFMHFEARTKVALGVGKGSKFSWENAFINIKKNRERNANIKLNLIK